MSTDSVTPIPVAPVIDYEPPARASTPCRSAPPPTTRHRPAHPPQLRPDRPPRTGLDAGLQSAAIFADAALRRVLEVVDGRRPPKHLHPLLAAGLAESVRSARVFTTPERAGPATLQRVRVQPAEPAGAVEAFGTYRRGRRIHALACRIEPAPAQAATTAPGTMSPGTSWRIVALHIG